MNNHFEFDDHANFRLVVGDAKSDWTLYQHIAQLSIGTTTYIGVSQYYGELNQKDGLIPEQIYKIEKIDTMESEAVNGTRP